MGSSASKPARSAASAVSRRQYPKQPSSGVSGALRSQGKTTSEKEASQGSPAYKPEVVPESTRPFIDLDGREPEFAASLRKSMAAMDSVPNPGPTLSNTSTWSRLQQGPAGAPMKTVFPESANPALLVFAARERAAKAAEKEAEEFGRTGTTAREYLDALTIRQALSMRDRNGMPHGEIEKLLKLKGGVLERLGGKGVIGEIQ